MHFTKMHGAGNDFIVLEAEERGRDWPRLALAMCHRHFGVGADGLLLLLPSTEARFCMRIFNADGSEAEACGNGLRCLVKYAADKGLIRASEGEVLVQTMAGISKARLQWQGKVLSKIQTGMGRPRLNPADIPVAIERREKVLDYPVRVMGKELPLSFISMGNPHAVLFDERPVVDFPLSEIGPEVEHHKLFPKRVNFEVVRVLNRKEIEARVWERGVGETLACGTGACAIAVIARLHNYIDNEVNITLPGGTLSVEWDGAGEVFLSGPVATVFTGEWQKEV